MNDKSFCLKIFMIKPIISTVITILLLAVVGDRIFAQTAKFNPDYPFAYWNMMTQRPSPTARQLFYDDKNLKNDGTTKAVLEWKKIGSDGTLTAQLLSIINGKKSIRMKISLKSNFFNEHNVITSLVVSNLQTGQTMDLGSASGQRSNEAETAGRLMGGFLQMLNLFYDSNKIFPKPSAEEDKEKIIEED